MTASRGSVELATRLVGAVWGHLVGDAVGVPYESRSAREIAAEGHVRFERGGGIWDQPTGTWSDDGALTLALLDSLLELRGFDVEDQGRRSVAWWREGAYTPDPGKRPFDIGNATRSAIDAIAGGAPAATAGRTDEMSCGNGSLMRILPIALVASASTPARRGRDIDADELIERAHAASRVTHGHPRAQVACSLYVLAAARLLAGERDRDAALKYAADRHRAWVLGSSAEGGAGAEMREALEHLLAWPERNGRGSVWDAFWSAWDAFAGASSYQQTIERAIAYGNDTDTTAAIAGGLAGIYWGIDDIPAEWLAGMRGREIVDPLVDGLLALQGWRTSTLNPLRVDWVDLAKVPRLAGAGEAGGALGMTFLPGKQRDGWTGLHWRNLRVDVATLRAEHRVDSFLLLVEDQELEAARVPAIAAVMTGEGIDVLHHPIRDMHVTEDREALRLTLDDVLGRLRAGQRVVVACRGGMGRTGTIVGCLLRDGGLDGDAAIVLTRKSRKNTIERPIQERFVAAWDWPEREALS
jgi:ADP-ribosyl-[dinitrogen reductase] hydrolase